MAQFSESSYRFTDPIRYFKANDPIYFEVDNIPLKQLQENDLWLKDQLAKLEYTQIFNTTSVTQGNTVAQGRAGFTELQPYVNNSDNRVYVRSGRFTARINDVFNLQPLQIINKLTDQNYINLLQFATNRDGVLRSVLNKFKTQLEANAIGMNGLIERCFTKASRDNDRASQFFSNPTPGYTGLPAGTPETPYPGNKGQLHVYNLATSSTNSLTFSNDTGTLSNPWQESNWIKKWRGVARTAVVDVPQELSIEIPPFNQEDFYYTDENGVRQTLNSANQRIDLVFIYSKPIDASAASIAKFPTGSTGPTKIYTPQLGIVKGAGIGLNLDRREFNTNDTLSTIDLQDSEGNQMIVPSISDELGANLGISGTIKGSFPSPDDLLNLAPTLSEDLESNHIALLGQSILPIAYIVVKKTAQSNPNQTPIITSADVIDIRPFFRTTELAYNERAGIAAAHPQISLANPVATEVYVDSLAKQLSERIEVVAQSIPTGGGATGTTGGGTTTFNPVPRVVYSGKITGGWGTYGPEFILFKAIKAKYPNISDNDAYDKVREEFYYPDSPVLDIYPTWDYALWANFLLGAGSQKGNFIFDYINFLAKTGEDVNDVVARPWLSAPKFGMNPGTGGNGIGTQKLHWVSKTLILNTQQVSWAKDFDVRVNYLNCIPVGDKNKAGGIFTNKEKLSNGDIAITINVAWENSAAAGDILNNRNQSVSGKQNNFFVLTKQITGDIAKKPPLTRTDLQGPSKYGTCGLPSVTFDIIGYPENWKQSEFLITRNRDTVITLK